MGIRKNLASVWWFMHSVVMLKGVIFDWDGVIIDSSMQHKASWERLAKEESKDLPAGHFERGFGSKNDKIIKEILKWTQDNQEMERIAAKKEEIYRDILRESGLEALPGVATLLKELKNAKVPCAVGSSTERKNIEVSLRMLGFGDYFSVIVCGDDVKKGKPDPEVFLRASESMGYAPKQCVVIEDAPVGIAAGKAAGMGVVGVGTSHEIAQLQEADCVVQSLVELNLKTIEKVANSLNGIAAK